VLKIQIICKAVQAKQFSFSRVPFSVEALKGKLRGTELVLYYFQSCSLVLDSLNLE